ncbi:hypothetical protein [Kitasatospora kifunensis]|uniref:Uncharacterized protein with von Willebrand factor type A (VWA) domain n=1 Tax=Kitasatospora kifunensis TaxID=58351 RepID=A0A7W7W0G0_KITKI|nr:hypothetical protein [Kitasatospora kifunensis]MBB4929128.1 uncharacterized protein with von Willebrand factor type A (vWA) domain [Kitasatospora kifunensis]
MGKTLNKLKTLGRQAGRWLGLTGGAAPEQHTTAVVGDRFDRLSWRDTYTQAPALRELADDLQEHHDHVEDLLQDAFLAAYKVTPEIRERAAMAPSRLVNHQVITAMAASPELAELRRETAGDPYAAAMAVLALTRQLRELLEQTEQAQDQAQRAEQAQHQAAARAEAVAEALRQAAGQADADGTVPEDAASAVKTAIRHAEDADQAAARALDHALAEVAAAAPGIRSAVRKALTKAATETQEETAVMRAWGVEPGQLERMDFQERAQLAQRLRTGRLARFADLIGRFRQMAAGERARRIEHAPGELVGITLGADLSRLVPAELAALAVPELRAVFASRFAQGELMLYDSRGEQETGQGAIIACVDCSDSMNYPYRGQRGAPTGEAWAKAGALALLDQARQAVPRRDFACILFSSAHQIRVFRFPASRPAAIGDVAELAEHFFGGGTDFESPLGEAVDLLAAEYNDAGRPRGDIVLITDAECAVGEDWMRRWNAARHELGFRVFGIAIGAPTAAAPGSVLDALCDNLRSIDDLADTHRAADLFRLI